MQLRKAIELCNYGFSIFPLGKDKVPIVKKWKPYQTVRPDIDLIAYWQTKFSNPNYAIVTGQISNVYIVDFDTEESLFEILKKGELPETVTVKTARGYHYYFRPNSKVLRSCKKFFPGVDFRGEGGYAMAAGSINSNGKIYSWINSPDEQEIAIIPEWLESLIYQHNKKSKKKNRERNKQNLKVETNLGKQQTVNASSKTLQNSFNKALRQLSKRIPSLIIQRSVDPTKSCNEFNKRFPDRERRIHYILWDMENEMKRQEGLNFYVWYGIILDNSKNRLKQFGFQIQHFLNKNGIGAEYNDYCSGRMKIIPSNDHSNSSKTHRMPQDQIK
jgi:hypothetical protein